MPTDNTHLDAAVTRLQEWSAQIEALEAEAQQDGEAGQPALADDLAILRQQRTELANRLAAARRGGPESWDELAQSYARISQRFADTLARARARN